MFSNLSKGSILYGLDRTGDNMSFFNATIEEAKPVMPMKLGQMLGSVMDISAIRDGESLTFQQIPSNNAIADFNNYLLADSKESLINYINSKLQASKNIVESCDKHKKLIEQYSKILEQINPNLNSAEINSLKEQMTTMQGQFSEVLTLLKTLNSQNHDNTQIQK